MMTARTPIAPSSPYFAKWRKRGVQEVSHRMRSVMMKMNLGQPRRGDK